MIDSKAFDAGKLYVASTDTAAGELVSWTQLGYTTEATSLAKYVVTEKYQPPVITTTSPFIAYGGYGGYTAMRPHLFDEQPTVPWPSTADGETNANLLDAAADYIEEHGWCQNTAVDSEGRVCAMGAVERAVGAWTQRGAARQHVLARLLAETLREIYPATYRGGIPDWNDMPDRTADEVVAVFRKTANKARETVTP